MGSAVGEGSALVSSVCVVSCIVDCGICETSMPDLFSYG